MQTGKIPGFISRKAISYLIGLLVLRCSLAANGNKELLINAFDAWKVDNEQTDEVYMLGIKV